MARDFIYIDSDKVKQTLKNALDMGEGDLSGNKLGLGSKITGVVVLNDRSIKPHLGGVSPVTAEHSTILFELDSPRITNILIYQANTETNAKDVDLEIWDDFVHWNGTTVSIANATWDYAHISDNLEPACIGVSAGVLQIHNQYNGINFKGKTYVKVYIQSAAGTAQDWRVWVSYESADVGKVTYS